MNQPKDFIKELEEQKQVRIQEQEALNQKIKMEQKMDKKKPLPPVQVNNNQIQSSMIEIIGMPL